MTLVDWPTSRLRVHYEDIAKFSWGDVMEWISLEPNISTSILFLSSEIKLGPILMLTCDRTEQSRSKYPLYKQLIFNILLYFNLLIHIFTFQKSSGQGCTRCPLVYQTWPSLTNEVHPVQARHPGNSFPVHQPMGSCPQVDQWPSLPLPDLVHPFLWPI